MVKNEVWSWGIELKTCPHCKEKINLEYISYKSDRDLVENFFKRLDFHFKNQCIDNIQPKLNKIFTSVKEKNLTTYQKNNFYF